MEHTSAQKVVLDRTKVECVKSSEIPRKDKIEAILRFLISIVKEGVCVEAGTLQRLILEECANHLSSHPIFNGSVFEFVVKGQ